MKFETCVINRYCTVTLSIKIIQKSIVKDSFLLIMGADAIFRNAKFSSSVCKCVFYTFILKLRVFITEISHLQMFLFLFPMGCRRFSVRKFTKNVRNKKIGRFRKRKPFLLVQQHFFVWGNRVVRKHASTAVEGSVLTTHTHTHAHIHYEIERQLV